MHQTMLIVDTTLIFNEYAYKFSLCVSLAYEYNKNIRKQVYCNEYSNLIQ